ncbi:Cytochrome C oxidase, cbb3-type, subunit III [Winogradskyella sediminis]|uniref:Cytochrome C oxidase, cbb3-type, subunit III n=2 Tax=Winogradskyella sediminis TaxID=1382466 RepID=A0A1H1TK71_9FLAO|nr:quinol:cytochrome c oxidoreductase monoheme cytochrome subunit [Winogradskyella sediminis]SDS60471.1 Cytochrome C oxidase, cbb3-type, subunit III [Winogradskyella sediminis]
MHINMKTATKYIAVIVVLVSFMSCQKNSRPNYQYMPNMYESVGYEAYQESDAFGNGVEAQLPAEGTIPRGDFMPFEIDNTTEGFMYAKANLTNPLDASEIDYDRGGELYGIYCGICHGNKGDGKGKLVQREKILGVPSYDDVGRAITTGSIYHTLYYGKNTMGSYANQLNEEERWQVVAYVEKLKADLEK